MGGRKKLIIANWKMHFTVKQAVNYASKLAALPVPEGVSVIIAPPVIALNEIAIKLDKTPLKLAAQNAYFQDEGAYTGEVSMPMLTGLAQYVLIGHSERRHVFGEGDDVVMQKVAAAVRSGLRPILCVGDTLLERTNRHTTRVLHHQVVAGLSQLTAEEVAKVIIAYEPVWAISNGHDYLHHAVATPEEAVAAAATIRHNVAVLYGADTAQKVRVLYGASVSAELVNGFLKEPSIDGLLVGGASLHKHAFWPIVEAAAQATPTKISVNQAKDKKKAKRA